MSAHPLIVSLGAALGVGLLIGVERERRKGDGARRAPAGLRTFTLASIAGALGMSAAGELGLLTVLAAVAILAAAGYRRSREADPGLTTEVALLVTTLLGGYAVRDPVIAAGAGVVVAALLAARTPLHRFVRAGLTDAEARDALILTAAALVVLPLLPDRSIGPYGALNLHALWRVVVLVLAISAAGHVAVRALGARYGLAVAGLASGFVSSVATIGALGARARKAPEMLPGAAAGAILSTVATVIQMSALVGATSLPTLRALAPSLMAAGAAALAYAAFFTAALARDHAELAASAGLRAFSLLGALAFAGMLGLVLLGAAALRVWFGETGVLAAAAIAGFADAHSAAISVAYLVAEGKLAPTQATAPILAGFLTNTISKAVFAVASGGRAFALRVLPGLALVVLAAWAGLFAAGAFTG